MRCSTSRMESRYSPSLVRSCPPEATRERRDLARQAIENAAILLDAPAPFLRGVAAPEEPLEHEARIRLRRQRLRRRLPRQRVHVGARVAVVAGADDVVAVDGDLQRRQLRVAADPLGDELVDRRPRLHVRAFGLLRVHRAHERRRGPRMLPAGVALVGGRVVVEPAQDERPAPEALQRPQDGRQVEPGALRRRRPVEHVHAVPDVDRGETRRGRRPSRQRRHHRVEQRQGQRGAHPAQERPPRQRQLLDQHRGNSPKRTGSRFPKGERSKMVRRLSTALALVLPG